MRRKFATGKYNIIIERLKVKKASYIMRGPNANFLVLQQQAQINAVLKLTIYRKIIPFQKKNEMKNVMAKTIIDPKNIMNWGR